SYEKEKEIKADFVKEAFKKAGLPNVEIAPIIGSPSDVHYRNKAQYPIAKTKGGDYVIGFFAPKSHRVTEARACPLSPEVFPEILDTLAGFFKKHELSVYDEESGKGLLRHIYMRRGEVSGEILLTLVINGTSLPHSEELVKLITGKFADVVGILLNVNERATNVILGDKFITLYGRDYIYDTLAGVRLKITAPSFYQVNHDAAELLYGKARELAEVTKDDVLLDLYCGAGSIGLSMAKDVRELIGIEIVESAVKCARENAADNEITNAKFYTGDASDTEKLLDNAEADLGRKINPTVIILDPPRAGCDEKLINYVAKLLPKRVVYISCNPTTLARDVAIFKKLGYECSEVTPVDLFPATGHVESVVCLTRRLDNELRERMN
ncbi:MAG: 23S rRNA (uracil(1939)-C(5))-methyltransferase RlmD, partial [Clostridia bacterium]|nr:23S rRNA (uracil(1939)-C(5))-methyltransferase RlmD [Clostridia bacterium]